MNSKLIIAVVGIVLAASSYSQVLPRRGLPPRKVIHNSANSSNTNVSEKVDFHKIRLERREKALELLSKIPMSSASLRTFWTRGEDTNDVTITVLVGTVQPDVFTQLPIFRDLTFDKDGKLKSVSQGILGNGGLRGSSSSNPANLSLED